MSYTADAADQILRIVLTTGEITLQLTASLLKNTIALIAALAKHHKKVCGKIRLTKLLRTTRELHCCTIPQAQYQAFRRLAKRYGVQYAVLRDVFTGAPEIVCAESELNRVNHIFHLLMPEAVRQEPVKTAPKLEAAPPRRSVLSRLEESRALCEREAPRVPTYEREDELIR